MWETKIVENHQKISKIGIRRPKAEQLADLNRALRQKRPEYQPREHKVIFIDDNAPAHRTKKTRELVNSYSWEALPHAPYSPDLAPFDYHLFSSMGHALAEQRFDSYENVKKWLDDFEDWMYNHFY